MRQVTIKVAAGATEEIGVVGNYVRVKAASVPVRIRAEAGQVDAYIEQGDALNLKRFAQLRISHADVAEQVITLMIGDDTSADSAKVGGSVAVSGVTNNGGFSEGNASIINGVYTLLNANAARRFLMIQNNDTAVDAWLRFDGTAGSVGQCFKLAANGGSIVFDTFCPTGPVSIAGSAAGTANSVHWAEV